MTDCISCERIRQRDLGMAPLWDGFYRTELFDVVHCDSTSILGWMIIIPRRHIAAIGEMTEAEALEMGLLARNISIALKDATACEKTYVVQFAEAEGYQHVHFHIIPRAKDLPADRRGPNVFRSLGLSPEQRTNEPAMNNISAQVLSHLRKGDSF